MKCGTLAEKSSKAACGHRMTSSVLCPFFRSLFSFPDGYCWRCLWSVEGVATGGSCGRSLKGLSRLSVRSLSQSAEWVTVTYEYLIISTGIKPITYFDECKVYRNCGGGSQEILFLVTWHFPTNSSTFSAQGFLSQDFLQLLCSTRI